MMEPREREYLSEVETAFAPELRAGELTIVNQAYSSHAFGDAVVVLEGLGLRLKLKRDRSEPYALVASLRDPECWARLQAAVSASTGQEVPGAVEALGWELTIDAAAEMFRQHKAALALAYESWWRWRTTRRSLRDLEKAQQERLDEWLTRPKTEEETERDASIERRLQNPSDEVKAVLKSLGLGKYK